MIALAFLAGGVTFALAAFVLGFAIGKRWPRTPAVYSTPVQMPVARLLIIERVRDHRADLRTAFRGRA